jgi:hypothetical protein
MSPFWGLNAETLRSGAEEQIVAAHRSAGIGS